MNSKVTIVSGGDSGYFDLLKELLASLKKLNLSENFVISFLDGGLKNTEKSYFNSMGASVLDPGWPDKISKLRAGRKEFLKVEVAKAHLDQLFPHSEHIIWIDADAWLQNAEALKIMLTITSKNKLAIYSQASRLQEHHIQYKKIFGPIVILRNALFKTAIKGGLSKNIKNSLIARPTLNAGIFALRTNAPHWKKLKIWQKKLLNNPRIRIFSTTQLALGIISYHEKMPFEPLPEICNYMGPYRWSSKLNLFTHIYAPYEPISIIHMAGLKEIRENRLHTIEVIDENDNIINTSLRFKL